jgi:hypothetical protein
LHCRKSFYFCSAAMSDLSDSPAAPGGPPPGPDPDPEIEALLDFEPVVRKCVRHDGWLPDRQRDFIRALVVLGHAEQAAIAVGGTMSGVYKLRTAAGGESFAAAWDSALALHLSRHPRPEPKGRPSRGEILSGAGRTPWPANDPKPPPGWVDPTEYYMTPRQFADGILRKYRLKIAQERIARLEGRIVEADYYVRQLTWLEVALDLGGNADLLLHDLKRGGAEVGDIVATPMSLLLDSARRQVWAERGEPERPPSPPLGRHNDEIARGERHYYSSDLDGPDSDGFWRRRKEEAAVAAEAQKAWEEKARREAAKWARREAGGEPRGRPSQRAEEEGAGPTEGEGQA